MNNEKESHILIVDDQQSWCALIQAILEESGYRVSCANSYDQAVALVQHASFDVAILDVRLVDAQAYNVQGIALLKLIREYSPLAKAVILTGYPDPVQRDKALQIYKADAYLEKVPMGSMFDVDGFSQLVSRLARQKHMEG